MKTCSRCKQEKEPTEFYKKKDRLDGLSYWCKECTNSYMRTVKKPGYQTTYTRRAFTPKTSDDIWDEHYVSPNRYDKVEKRWPAFLERLKSTNRILV